jgi:hypothetical protein
LALRELIEWDQHGRPLEDRNEALTRLHLIDRLLSDCLGWPIEDWRVEDRAGDGSYADYCVGRPVRLLLVEAKREGMYFELPVGFDADIVNIATLVVGNAPIRDALSQASAYSQTRGIAMTAVSNGYQLIAFLGSRQDGVPPLEGRALVFSSLEDMQKRFRQFWDNLSRPGVEARNLFQTLQAPGNIPPPDRLSARLVNYPGFRIRNTLQTELQILGGLFLEDIVKLSELEPEFLRDCYCPSGALSQYALVSREILRTRYSVQFQEETEIHAAPVRDKDGLIEDIAGDALAASLSRRPIVLLGDVGVGKTIFIRHFMAIDANDVLDRSLVFYVDFGSKPALSRDLNDFVIDEFARQLLTRYKIDVEERQFVRGVYHFELQRFENSIYKDLKAIDQAAYIRAEVDFLSDKVRDRESHLKACLEHIARGQKRQIVIFLDNVDQRPWEFQEQVFLIAQGLAENWPGTIFVSLRPETFFRSKATGSITGYQPRVFTIAPPRVDLVIGKRLAFAKKQLEEKGRLPNFPAGLTLRSEVLTSYINVLIRSFERNFELNEFVDNLSGGNIRRAMGFLETFVGSGHVDTQKILNVQASGGYYMIPLHEFMRAVIYGDYEYYDPGASPIANLLDISSVDPREHFLMPVLLTYIQKRGELGNHEGYVTFDGVFDFAQRLAFDPIQIRRALERGASKGLLEVSPRFGEDTFGSRARITTVGAYSVKRLLSSFTYLDAVVVDTPIVRENFRARIVDVRAISDRLRRVEILRAYLDTVWQPLAGKEVLFDWPVTSGTVREEVTAIGRKVDPINWP